MTAITPAGTSELADPLTRHRDRIMDALEGAALEVGRELLAARAAHPDGFYDWVAEELPFSVDKARRLMEVARFADSTDPKVLAALPKGWTILFELRRLPPERLAEAAEAGKVGPEMGREEAKAFVRAELDPIRKLLTGSAEVRRHEKRRGNRPGPAEGTLAAASRRPLGDSLVRELIRTPRGDLSEPMETLLRSWLDPEGYRS